MIDWTRLDSISVDLGALDTVEFVTIFLSETAPVIERLDPASPRFFDDLHFIKGSAANLGLDGLKQACVAAERSHRRAEPVDLARITRAFVGLRTALIAYRDQIRNSASVASSVMSR